VTISTPLRRSAAAIATLQLILVGSLLVLRWRDWLSTPSLFQDLRVYRDGANALLSGSDLYVARTSGHGQLVFTYPPFAAAVFAFLAVVSWPVAAAAMLLLSGLSYFAFTGALAQQLRWSRRASLAAALIGLLAEPVLRTVQQGQINLVLAALVVLDAFILPARLRGVLTGLVAGVKLIPAVFVLYYVARRDWPAAARATVTGAATIAIMWMIAPTSSQHYWTVLLLDPTRSGGGGYPDNQSLAGVAARILHNDQPSILITLPLQVAALLLAYLVARRLVARHQEVGALTAVAVGGLLASPVSWSHHWIWAIPMVIVLIDQGRRITAALCGGAFVIAPLTLSPLGWLHDTPRPLWILATLIMPLTGLAWLTRMGHAPSGPGQAKVGPTSVSERVRRRQSTPV